MAQFYQTVKNLSKETLKQIFVQELNEYGIYELRGTDLLDLDYYTLRSMMAAERISRGL